MAISTKGIGQVDLSSGIMSKNSLKSKAEEGAVDSFSSLINMTSTNVNNEKGKISDGDLTNNYVDSVDKSDSIQKNDNPNGKQIETADKNVSEGQNKVNDKKEAYGSVENAVDKETVEISDKNVESEIENLADMLASLINQITDILKDMLGIGDEELEENLSVLDMNFTDLLNNEGVNEFVLYSKGATEVDILIDEQLASLLSDINEDISEVLASFEKFDIEAESVSINIDNNNIVVDMKEISTKADEILSNPEDEKVAVDTKKEEDETSFIPKNADNNISDAGRMTSFNISRDNNGNNSSQNFNSSNESIMNNLNNAVNNAAVENINDSNEFVEGVSQADIIRQVVDEIKANVTNEIQTLEMRLNPESLGRVQISVSQRNGVMQAQIVAETEAAKTAIEANIATLRETFNNQDLKVEAVEVTIAEYGFFEGQEQDMPDENNSNQSNGRNIRVNTQDSMDEVNEDEQLETEIMRAQGNSVSYSI